MAAGSVIDVASVKVEPDTSGFRQKLRAELSRIDDDIEIDAELNLDSGRASSALEAWRRRQEARSVDIRVNYDRNALAQATSAFGTLSKNMLIAGGAASLLVQSGSGISQLGTLLVQASGAAWLLPAALTAAAAAGGTVLIGMQGIKDAFKATTGPAKELQRSVEDTFRKGFRPLASSVAKVIPQLTGGFNGIARAISGAATGFGEMLSKQSTVSTLNDLLDGTSRIVTNLGKGFAPLVEAFLNIADIGMGSLEQLTGGAEKAATKFRDWTESAEGITKITGWIANAGEAFKTLGRIGSNIWGIFTGLFRGLSEGGFTVGQTLEQLTGRMDAFLNSAKGSAVLGALGGALRTLSDTFTNVLGSALETLGPAVARILPNIESAIRNLGKGIENALPGIRTLIEKFGPFIEAVGRLLPGFGEGIGIVASALGRIAEIATPVVNFFAGLNESMGGLPAKIAGVAGAVFLLSKRFSAFRLSGFVSAITSGLGRGTAAITTWGTTAGNKMAAVPKTWGSRFKGALGTSLRGAGIGLLLTSILDESLGNADKNIEGKANSTGQKIGDGVKFGLNFLGPIGIGASFANSIIEGITGVDVIGEVAKVFTGEHVSYIKEVVADTARQVQQSWTQQIQIMKAQNAVLAAQMGTDWKINGDKIKSWTTETYNQIRDIIGGRTNDAKNRSTNNGNTLSNNWRDALNRAVGASESNWNKIFGTTNNKSNQAANRAGSNANKLSNDWRNGVNRAVGANNSGWNSIFQGAQSGATRAAQQANRGATLTIAQWAQMASHGYSAGAAAGNAVGDGIASAQSRAERIAANFASSVQNQLNNIIGAGSIGGTPIYRPGLATGGTITSHGEVLVGEKGPEILTLSKGAQVTPLTNNDRRTVLSRNGGGGSTVAGDGIDYARLGAAVAAAMENVRFELDGRPVARAVNDQNRVDRRR